MTIDCPYCGKSQQYTGDPLGDGDEAEDECRYCGKKFTIIVSVSVTAETVECEQ